MTFKIQGFGWRRGLNDPRDYTPDSEIIQEMEKDARLNTKKGKLKASTTVPKTVDNSKWCSPISDQKNLGSCTANMGVSMLEYMEKKSYGQGKETFVDGSRLFLYKTTRFLMGQEGIGDSGAYIRTTLGAIRMFGVPNEQYWPYTDDPKKFDVLPNPLLIGLAQNFKGLKHFRVDYSSNGDENIRRMREYLYAGYCLGMGFTVFSSYQQSKTNGGSFPFPSTNEGVEGGHAVTIIGYDDNRSIKNTIDDNTQTGAFKIQNSWGESWGEKGFGWIPYAYFRTAGNGDMYADDVWALTKIDWLNTGEFFW